MSWKEIPKPIQDIIMRMAREMNAVLEFQRFWSLIWANLCFN